MNASTGSAVLLAEAAAYGSTAAEAEALAGKAVELMARHGTGSQLPSC